MYTLPAFLTFVMLISVSYQQNIRIFPPLQNVAGKKPVISVPSQASCGYPTSTSYCLSSTSASSVQTCYQDYCIQSCPFRNNLPDFINLLNVSIGYGACVVKDSTVTAYNGPGMFSAYFSALNSLCRLSPTIQAKCEKNQTIYIMTK